LKLKKIQESFHNELDTIYGSDEVNSIFYLLIEAYTDFSRIQLALNPEYEVMQSKSLSFFDALQKLKQDIPIQYILGKTEFYGLTLEVNEHTLIPRPETEELVHWIIEEVSTNKAGKSINILDIGTGSGCIAISLAKHLPEANVYGLDISKEALKVAQNNADINQVAIYCIKKDILNVASSFIDDSLQFDIIVSNPPYVRKMEMEAMKANVLKHEPHLALLSICF